MTDPIESDDYHPYRKREANPERIARIKLAAEAWRSSRAVTSGARRKLDDEIVAAHATGHSFTQLRDASGLSVSAVQNILAKREREEAIYSFLDEDESSE